MAGALRQELPLSPNATLSLGLDYQTARGFNASARVTYVGAQQAALNQNVLDSYKVADLSAGYRVERPYGQTPHIDAYVENLFDERYETFSEPNAYGGCNRSASRAPRAWR